jgi:hypothetical protein
VRHLYHIIIYFTGEKRVAHHARVQGGHSRPSYVLPPHGNCVNRCDDCPQSIRLTSIDVLDRRSDALGSRCVRDFATARLAMHSDRLDAIANPPFTDDLRHVVFDGRRADLNGIGDFFVFEPLRG